MSLQLILTTGADGYYPSQDKLVFDDEKKDYYINMLRSVFLNYEEEIKEDHYHISDKNGRYANIIPYVKEDSEIFQLRKIYESINESN